MKSISVIIPAHNEEKYAARCIRSVKAAFGDFSQYHFLRMRRIQAKQ